MATTDDRDGNATADCNNLSDFELYSANNSDNNGEPMDYSLRSPEWSALSPVNYDGMSCDADGAHFPSESASEDFDPKNPLGLPEFSNHVKVSGMDERSSGSSSQLLEDHRKPARHYDSRQFSSRERSVSESKRSLRRLDFRNSDSDLAYACSGDMQNSSLPNERSRIPRRCLGPYESPRKSLPTGQRRRKYSHSHRGSSLSRPPRSAHQRNSLTISDTNSYAAVRVSRCFVLNQADKSSQNSYSDRGADDGDDKSDLRLLSDSFGTRLVSLMQNDCNPAPLSAPRRISRAEFVKLTRPPDPAFIQQLNALHSERFNHPITGDTPVSENSAENGASGPPRTSPQYSSRQQNSSGATFSDDDFTGVFPSE